MQLAAFSSASPNAAVSLLYSAVKGSSQRKDAGDFSETIWGALEVALPLYAPYVRRSQDMIHSSVGEPEMSLAMTPGPLQGNAGLPGLVSSIEASADSTSSLKIIPAYVPPSRDRKPSGPAVHEKEAADSSLTGFAIPAKTGSSLTARSSTDAADSPSAWSLDMTVRVTHRSSLGASLVDKILGVSGALVINSRASTVNAEKASYKQSNIEYSGEVISSHRPTIQLVASMGAAVPNELIGRASPNPLADPETKSPNVALINGAVPEKTSAIDECPAIVSRRSGCAHLKMTDSLSVDQHNISGEPADSLPPVFPLSVPIYVSVSPSIDRGALVETSRGKGNNAQYSPQPTASSKDSATRNSKVFAIATQLGVTTLGPLALLPSLARELPATPDKEPTNERDLKEHDGSSQFARRSSPMPLSATGSTVKLIGEAYEERSQVPGGGLLAFKATLTPTELTVEPAATTIKSTIALTGPKATMASSPCNSDPGATDSPADPDLAEVDATSALGPIEHHGLAENALQDAELHKDNVTDTSKLTMEEHRPELGDLPIDMSVVLSPAGNTSSGTDRSRSDSDAPEKSESKNEINLPNPPQPTRDISVKVGGGEMANADIRLSERGGKILVSVRSGNPELAQSLRADLGNLVSRLESRGYRADITIPIVGPSSRNPPDTTLSRDSSDPRGSNGHQPQQQHQQESRSRPALATDLSTFQLEEVLTDERKLNP